MNYKLKLLTVLLALLAVANVLWGSLDIPVRDVWHILCGGEVEDHPAWSIIVLQGRLPQMLTALLTGMALGTCGLLLQTAFRNPLAGPSILGIDSGANLGVAIVLLLLGGTASIGSLTIGGHLLVVVAAMAGALSIMSLLMILGRLLHSGVMLLITGVIISYVTGSIIQLLNYSATEQGVFSFVMWGMGNFASVGPERLPVFCILCVLGLLLALLLGLYFFLFGNQATTPDQIARKVGIKLPAYQITKAEDNMDRTASAWSDYYFEIEFEKPLSEKFLQKVEKLKNCIYEGDSYKIEKESPEEWAGYIMLYPEENKATLEYTFRDALF